MLTYGSMTPPFPSPENLEFYRIYLRCLVPQVISNHSNRYINHCCSCACVLVGDIHNTGMGNSVIRMGGGRWGDGDALLSHLLNLKYFAQSHIIIINKCTHPYMHGLTQKHTHTHIH